MSTKRLPGGTMSSYSVSNMACPGACATTLTIPVVEDAHTKMAVRLPFRAQLKIGTPLAIALDQAIQAADRHVYVHGRPPNAVSFVEEWINVLRWEVNNLWTIIAGVSRYARSGGVNLTPEHYKRSGEILAEGMAIVFLADRLGIPRQRFFFFNGKDARPDFVVRLKGRQRRALALNRRRFMLEVRSRNAANMRNISAVGRAELGSKKQAVHGSAGTLAVYCCYGAGQHQDGMSHTRIHLADPPEQQAGDASDAEIASIAIHHYLRVTSQLGLWDHRDHLLQAARLSRSGEMPTGKMRTEGIERGVSRPYESQDYIGRDFNELITMAFRQPASVAERKAIRQSIRRRVRGGDYGTLVFRGLNADVLRLIERSDWITLADFRDPQSAEFGVSQWVRSDGLFRKEVVVDPNSPQAREVESQLRTVLE